MKKKKLVLLISIILFLSLTVSFNNADQDRRIRRVTEFNHKDFRVDQDNFRSRVNNQRYASNEVLVKFKSSLTENEVASLIEIYQSERIRKIPKLNVYQIQIPEHYSVEEMVYAFDRNPDVEYAEPNYIARITETPNDLLFREQYALNNTGQDLGVPGSPSGTARADIKAPEGWEETKGTDATVIAILDTGIDLVHPDLQNKIISGGRDFVNDDFDASDDNWHGTHVAGIAAADTNNNEGIAGVAWNCRLLPVKVLDDEGDGFYSWIADGIRWAADEGADVISMSFGGPSEGAILREALNYAKAAGIKGGNFKKLNLPFENKLLGQPIEIRERMIQRVETFIYDMNPVSLLQLQTTMMKGHCGPILGQRLMWLLQESGSSVVFPLDFGGPDLSRMDMLTELPKQPRMWQDLRL